MSKLLDTVNRCQWSRNFSDEQPHDGVIEVADDHPFFAGFDNGTHCIKWPEAELVAYSPEEIAASEAANAMESFAVVSPRQIRQALTAIGLRQSVEAAVAAGNQDLKDWWEFATSFERNHPMVMAMAQGLGVSEADIDGLFVLAASL